MVSRGARGSLTQEISGFDAQACPLRHLPAPSRNVGCFNIRINESRFGVFIAWKADEIECSSDLACSGFAIPAAQPSRLALAAAACTVPIFV